MADRDPLHPQDPRYPTGYQNVVGNTNNSGGNKNPGGQNNGGNQKRGGRNPGPSDQNHGDERDDAFRLPSGLPRTYGGPPAPLPVPPMAAQMNTGLSMYPTDPRLYGSGAMMARIPCQCPAGFGIESALNQHIIRLNQESQLLCQEMTAQMNAQVAALRNQIEGMERRITEEVKRQVQCIGTQLTESEDQLCGEIQATQTTVAGMESRISAVEKKTEGDHDSGSEDGRIPLAIQRLPRLFAQLEADVKGALKRAAAPSPQAPVPSAGFAPAVQLGGASAAPLVGPSASLPPQAPVAKPGSAPAALRPQALATAILAKRALPEAFAMPSAKRLSVAGMEGEPSVANDPLESFFKVLKNLDLASQPKMEVLLRQVQGPSTAFECPIFEYDYGTDRKEVFYLKIGGSARNRVLTSGRHGVLPNPRREFDFPADKISQSVLNETLATASGVLQCVITGATPDFEVPEYLLPLGEIYRITVYTQQRASRDSTMATNFFVFLNVLDGSLWAMYRHEIFFKDGRKPRNVVFKPEDRLFERGDVRDVFCLLESIADWESPKEVMLKTTQQIKNAFGDIARREPRSRNDGKMVMKPLFTLPFYEDLMKVIDREEDMA